MDEFYFSDIDQSIFTSTNQTYLSFMNCKHDYTLSQAVEEAIRFTALFDNICK